MSKEQAKIIDVLTALVENPFNLRVLQGGISVNKETGKVDEHQAPAIAIVDAEVPFVFPDAKMNDAPRRGLIAVVDAANGLLHLNEMYATASECYYFHGLAKCYDLNIETWEKDLPF
jgi:hypothetical protein